MSETTPEPTEQPQADQPVKPQESAGPSRYAVYNTTLQQFVGGVHDRKPSKAQVSAMLPEGHRYEIRNV